VNARFLEWVKKWQWFPYLVYALLSTAILWTLFGTGYILSLDMVFAPDMDFTYRLYGMDEWPISAGAPRYLLIQLVSNIVPAWLVQKLLLFFTFFLCGVGAHRLLPVKGAGKYFAGLLYTINPFTYVRFLSGQWGVLAAYALIPFAVKAFLDLLESGGKKNAIKVALFSSLVGIFQLHGVLPLFLAFFIILVVRLISRRREPARIVHDFKCVGISAAMFLGLNLYWLVPTLTTAGTTLNQIGQQDLLFFAAKPTSNFGVVFDIVSMYGFWRGGYLYTKDILPFWWLIFGLILFFVIYGFMARYRDERLGWKVVSLAIVAVIGFLLAIGPALKFTQPLWERAWEHISLLRAFRDSQKYVALLCLAYSCLGGLGIAEINKKLRQQTTRILKVAGPVIIIIILLTPLVYSFNMFGFQSQVGTTDYPQGWYKVNEYLNQDEDDFNVLFLPWHLYMDYSWLPNRDKRLANPAWRFFNKPIIAGDNIEVPRIYSQSTSPVSKYTEFLLFNKNKLGNFGELLAPINVKYVILAHESDYESYEFLYHQMDLTVVLQSEEITLFRNEHPVAKAYGVDSVVFIESLEEYLELSQTHDVTEHLFIMENAEMSGVGYPSLEGGEERSSSVGVALPSGSPSVEGIECVELIPVRYDVGGSQRKYTIFTLPQEVSSDYWEYDGRPAIKNLGFMPTFSSTPDGGEVVYTRFYHVFLPSYIISLMTLAFMAWYYFWGATKGS